MGFLDKLLGRKPEGDEAQAAAAPAADTAAETGVTAEQGDAHDHDHDHDHGESDHSH
jgi:hypothetical protein